MTETGKANIQGTAFALLAFALYSTHDVAVKTLGQHYSPFQIIFFSVLMGFPLATLMLMRDPTAGHLRPVYPLWNAVRTVATIVTGICAFYAFSVLPLAQVYAFIFAAPLLITILSVPILGEKVGIHRAAAVLVGLAGVMIVLRPGAAPFSLGHLAGLTAAFGSALASVIVRKIGRQERSAVLILYPMVTSFAVMSLLMPAYYKPMPLAHLGLAGMMAALAFAASLLTIEAYRRADAAVVAPMQYSQIIWAAVFGLAFFDEVPDLATLLGASVIIASGLYIVLRESLAGVDSLKPVTETRTRLGTPASPRISAMLRSYRMHYPDGYEPLANGQRAK